MLMGMLLTCGGAWIKIFAVRNAFWVAFLGQFVVAMANAFVISVPPRLAAIWFGPSQVSLACSIGVFGNQVRMILEISYCFFVVSLGIKTTYKSIKRYIYKSL